MNEQVQQTVGGGGGDAAVRRPGPDRGAVTTLAWTILTAALLAFASFAKFYQPQHEKELMDRGIASVQVLIIIGVLVFWRRWWTWGALAVMWTGMAAWSIWASANGAKCGCFGSLVAVPDYVSGTVDAMFALVSLSLALLRGAPRAMLAGIAVGMAAAWPAGWYGASVFVDPGIQKQIERARLDAARNRESTQPVDSAPVDDQGADPVDTTTPTDSTPVESFGIAPPELPDTPGFTPARERLLQSELMADIREQEIGGPAWLIFVHDPDCHICEALMPYMQFMGQTWEDTGDPLMQLRMHSIPDLRGELGIARHHWPNTPTLFVVRDGAIVAQWYGETADGWQDAEIQMIYDALEADDPSFFPAEPQWEEMGE